MTYGQYLIKYDLKESAEAYREYINYIYRENQ